MIGLSMRTVGMASAMSMLNGLRAAASGGSAQYVVGTDVEYAAYVEFGTYKMAAQPYMRPAAREVQANIGRHISGATSLDAAVESAALDVERRAKQHCPVDTGRLRASITARKQ